MIKEMQAKLKKHLLPVVIVAQLVVISMMIVSFWAREFWWADVFSHFYPQYLFASLLTLVFALFTRTKMLAGIGGLSLLVAYTIIMHSLWIFPRSLPVDNKDLSVSEAIRIAQVNYFYANHDFEGLENLINDHNPDIINFQEAAPSHSKHIDETHRELYPYQIHHPRAGSYGTIIMSKLPMTKRSVHIVNGGVFNNEIFDVTLQTALGRDMRLLSLHTAQPLGGPDWTQQRNVELYAAAELLRRHKGEKALLNNGIGDHEVPVIIVGDLNITPYSPFFRDIIRSTQQQFWGRGRYSFCPHGHLKSSCHYFKSILIICSTTQCI
jgi:endonuclease/exonuclease/phosphatase (EEP) superfamily protein YafD